MTKRAVLINLDKKDYDDLHNLMNLSLQSEDGITVYRVTKSTSKQGFYRQVIQAGIESIYKKFVNKKNELSKDES